MNTGHLAINGLTKHVHASVDATGLFREADQIFGALRATIKGKKRDSVTTFDGINLPFFFGSRAARVYFLIRQKGIHRNFSGPLSLNAPPIVKTVVSMLLLSFYLTPTSPAPCPI